MKKTIFLLLSIVSGFACAMDNDPVANMAVDDLLRYGLGLAPLGQQGNRPEADQSDDFFMNHAQTVNPTSIARLMKANRPADKGVSKRKKSASRFSFSKDRRRIRLNCAKELFPDSDSDSN